MMTTYESRLVRSEEIADETRAFHFERPAGFAFKPGQAIDVILVDVPAADVAGSRHTFSIVTAPYQEELVVATRMRDSAYKRALKSLAMGAPVALEGPSGSLTLHRDRTREAVFIAGGIGITPFVSILRQANHEQLDQRFLLLHSNRRPEDAAFRHELQLLEGRNQAFRLVPTMTQMSTSRLAWSGETGPIDEELLRRTVGDLSAPIYYVAGPPGMVEAMRLTLNRIGVDDDDMRSEEFYGY